MLIRKLNVNQGLINGVRILVNDFGEYNISTKCIHSDRTVVILCINLIPFDPSMCFQLIRNQFPIKVDFAIIINKAQGQTFERAGLYSQKPLLFN